MTENPLVIFINKGRATSCGLTIDYDLPCGWNAQGVLSPLQANQTYLILLFDDDKDVPEELPYANKKPDAPLFVIGHITTPKHEKPDEDARLKNLGKPIIVGKFHHRAEKDLDSDETFKQIYQLINGNMEASAFVKTSKDKYLYYLYSNLAAISQIMLLDNTVNISVLASKFVQFLPPQDQEEIRNLRNNDGPPDAKKLLDLVYLKISNYKFQ